jgi:beta-glucosidase
VKIKRLILIAVFAALTGSFASAQSLNAGSESRIEKLISAMTLEEKVRMLGGNEFETFSLPRLGIPSLTMTDGALGVHYDLATAFPSGLSMGATFDPALIFQVAAAMGDEARFRGRRMLLGPCVNINRHPLGGRNFENYGEDPYLSGRIAAEFVRGVQSQGVIATVKHLTANDQETERQTIDVRLSTRALMEIYLPAFKAAIDAGSLSVMTAYNKINGEYASENRFLITDVLKSLWGFRGFVVSDWESTHSTINAANNGLDLEMPTGLNFNSKLVDAVEQGSVSRSLIDDKVRRILRAMFAIGIDLESQSRRERLPAPVGPQSQEHKALALKVAQDSLVLLKNEGGVLPLKSKTIRSIALIGPNALEARTGGGGSSHVGPVEATSPAEEIKNRLGTRVRVVTALGARLPGNPALMPAEFLRPDMTTRRLGLRGQYFAGSGFSGRAVIDRVDRRFDFRDAIDWSLKGPYSVRWSGYMTAPRTGLYDLAVDTWNHARVVFNTKEVISRWDGQGPHLQKGTVFIEAGKWYPVIIEFFTDTDWANLTFGWDTPEGTGLLEEAVAAARSADVAVVFAGLGSDMEGEGSDRESMAMPPGQVELIQGVARVNPRTVVVLTSGNPLSIESWISQVPSVLQTWYPGQAGGAAIADVLLGRVNPSGKLPITYLRKWEDSAAYGNFPGTDGSVKYEEGIFVGYRHFDAKNVEPLFAFGHGLSYTEFAYKNLRIEGVANQGAHLTFEIQNVGAVAGAEVAQIYVGEKNPAVERPVRELKSFKKVYLRPGEKRTIAIDLDAAAFSYFDDLKMAWQVTPQGVFTIDIGSSSRDLRLSEQIALK